MFFRKPKWYAVALKMVVVACGFYKLARLFMKSAERLARPLSSPSRKGGGRRDRAAWHRLFRTFGGR